jgi:hypothetical protein
MHTACNIPRLPRAALLSLTLLAGCDGMVQEIDIASSDVPPMLAVSAAISTDGGALQLSFTEARSTSSYSTWRSEKASIIRKGDVALYEDDNPEPIYRIVDGGDGQGFDMSLRTGVSGFSTQHKGLTFKAGSAYKLVLAIDGYPVATATAVMPDAPNVKAAPLNTEEVVRRSHPYAIGSSGGGGSIGEEQDFYPIHLQLTDNSRGRDYYMFWLQATTIYPGYPPLTADLPTGISSWALIQDNPDLEAEGVPIESFFDVYLFDRMLMSDMSFANATGAADLLVQKSSFLGFWDHPFQCDSAFKKLFTCVEICMSHLSPITYDHHRSLTLQREGVSFFTEPVSIASNVENGYGCFAAFNTVRDTVWSAYVCEQPYSVLSPSSP